MAWIIFKALILISMLCSVYSTKCPNSDLIEPCTCYEKNDPRRFGYELKYYYMSLIRNDSIVIGCRGNIFLSNVFEEIDEKYQGNKQFENFYLTSYPMDTIEENILYNSTFNETIIIANNDDLETIHQDAFTETGKFTKELIIARNRMLGNNVFEAIKKFTAAKTIRLFSNNITEIPSVAFTTQSNLSTLIINEKIKVIGSKAFNGLINLKKLIIGNYPMESIEENILHNSTFKEKIIIGNNNDLETIHQDAFTMLGKVTKDLIITGNKKLGNSVFEVIKKFSAATSIKITGNNIHEIPSGAFMTQNNISRLIITENIKTIGPKAFNGLLNLRHLSLSGDFNLIPEFAFEMGEKSKYPVYIELLLYNFNKTIFAPNALANIRRPTMLTFDTAFGTSIHYLKESLFLPFLQDNTLNKIFYYHYYTFIYKDTGNSWIKENKMEKRVYINGHSLYNIEYFH